MLDWDDFRVFLGVARAGTLSAAARQLSVDQSTMSRRLAALEAAAGSRLFDRTQTGYALTPAGEAVRKDAEEIEARAMAIERQLAGHDARPEGVVRLAASESFASWFLVPHLADLRVTCPGITIGLVTGNRAADLSRREADIAVRLSKPTEPQLLARRLGSSGWALYGSTRYLKERGKPKLRNELAGHDVIGFEPELKGTLGARWLAQHAARANVVLTTSSLVAHGSAVSSGLGLSPLPTIFGDNAPGVVRVLPQTLGHHDVWLLVHPDVKNSARVRAVMDYLSRVIGDAAPLLTGELSARPRQRPVSRRV